MLLFLACNADRRDEENYIKKGWFTQGPKIYGCGEILLLIHSKCKPQGGVCSSMMETVVKFLSLLPYIMQLTFADCLHQNKKDLTRVGTVIHTSLQSTRQKFNYNQNPRIWKMDPSKSFNQPPGAGNPPPVYQDNPAGYLTSFPGPSAQGLIPGQSVVAVQPAVFVTATPLANPAPDYTCYSIFTLLCCFLPLGTAALVYSLSVSINCMCCTRLTLVFKHTYLQRQSNALS